MALDLSQPGDVVLAPWDTSRVLSGMSVEVHPVSARAAYLPAYRGEASAHSEQRIALQHFIDSKTIPAARLEPLVDTLSVDTACVSAKRGAAVDALEAVGFVEAERESGLVCLRR